MQKKLVNFQSDYTKLEQKYSQVNDEKDRLKTYTRELEQINDDLERAQRVVTESVAGAEVMLHQAYEKNALLEMEVDEKEILQVKLQRLMDETRGSSVCLNLVLRFGHPYALLFFRLETGIEHQNAHK